MIGHTRIGNENTKMFAGPHNGTPRGALSAPVRPDGSDVHHEWSDGFRHLSLPEYSRRIERD